MIKNSFSHDRFKKVMIPSLVMGLLTNVYILVFQIWIKAYIVIPSPVIGSVIFLFCLTGLKKRKISSKRAFFLTTYTVVAEIFVHTCYFGWDSGFYYFMFLLPTVFLLNSKWKKRVIFAFNSSIFILAALLWSFFGNAEPLHYIPDEIIDVLNLVNVSGTAIVTFVIIVSFSRTILEKEEELIIANNELAAQNKEISEQHQNLQVLLREVHHRVKNNLQIISSLMSLQRRTEKDEAVINVLNENKRRIESIALIHAKLFQDDKADRIDFRAYLQEVAASQRIMTPGMHCVVNVEDHAFLFSALGHPN